METTKLIGDNIRKIREYKGIKQELLAKHLNITKGRMSQIENGDCGELTLNRLDKIALYLKVDFFELTSKQSQTININNSTNVSGCGFNGTHYNFSTELIQELVNELAKRMAKS